MRRLFGGRRDHRLTLLTRPGCHLCEDARALVVRVADAAGVPWEERNIDDDPDLQARYAEHIPVVLVDGRVVGHLRLDERRLRRALR